MSVVFFMTPIHNVSEAKRLFIILLFFSFLFLFDFYLFSVLINRANVLFMRTGNHRKYPRNIKIEWKRNVRTKCDDRSENIQFKRFLMTYLEPSWLFTYWHFGKVDLFAAGMLKIVCHVIRLKIECLRMCANESRISLYSFVDVACIRSASSTIWRTWIWWVTAQSVWGASTCVSSNCLLQSMIDMLMHAKQWSVCRHQSL